MRLSGIVLLLPLCLPMAFGQQNAVLFEGARLIAGDGTAPIENSAFIIQSGKFTAVGKKGDLKAPAGAVRVSLAGKTVMPALVDAHTHLGWEIVRTNQIGADTYTRENL